MSLNAWTQASGYSIGTFPERQHIDVVLPVTDTSSISLDVISGSLPNGLFIRAGHLVGSPYITDNVLNYTFCIRASRNGEISDRTFTLTIDNIAIPEFITPAGELAAGVHKQFYVIDGSYVSYQIEALDMNPVAGQTLRYSIEDGNGTLPPGLTLSDSGLISGFLGPALVTPAGVTHVFTLPYDFTVTVTDGVNFNTRTFEIFVADPNAFRADSLMHDGLAGKFTSDATYLQQPIWLTSGNLGLYRANNYLTIPVALYDNRSTTFRLEATNTELYASSYQVLTSDNVKPFAVTGMITLNSTSITSVSTTSNLSAGQSISGLGIPANTHIVSVDSVHATITISKPATGTLATPVVLSCGGNTVTITNASATPLAGQYLTFANYIPGADNTVYNISAVTALGSGNFRLTLSSQLTIDVDNGFTFYIGSLSELPPGMSFDPVTSEIYGRVPYQPAITTEYMFTITAVRSYISSSEQVVSYRTFTVDLLGDITSEIVWNSPTTLGPLDADYVSTLSLSASSSIPDAIVIYEQVSGTLPPGLSLSFDGELIGTVHQYKNELTGELGLITFDNGTTTFDSGTTTFDRSYKFTVSASDQYQYSSQSKQFTLLVDTPNTVPYSNVYAKPFLASDQRASWNSFITDTAIFTPSKIYRSNDASFGVQSNLRMLVVGGIETASANTYATSMINGFKKKQFYFDSIKTAVAVDPLSGDSVYEVIYAQLSDPLEPNGEKLSETITINNQTYYPNSITNWQTRLSNELLTERHYLPLWMRTIQPGTKAEIGFVPAVPLCYCKVGLSADILLNITNSGFDFRTLDYTVDRFIVDSVTGEVGDKYLAFSNNRTTI